MYKCCWNCGNGLTAVCPTKEETELFRAAKRFCCASYPVSKYPVNPFIQRYCKQFEPSMNGVRVGHEITKEEAKRLKNKSPAELVKYWRLHMDQET